MDGSRFDTLVKALATTSLSRANVVRGLAASAAALAGVTLATGPSVAKKKNEKKQKVCVCGADGTVPAAAPRRKPKTRSRSCYGATPALPRASARV